MLIALLRFFYHKVGGLKVIISNYGPLIYTNMVRFYVMATHNIVHKVGHGNFSAVCKCSRPYYINKSFILSCLFKGDYYLPIEFIKNFKETILEIFRNIRCSNSFVNFAQNINFYGIRG